MRSTKDAARILGISQQRVLALIQSGTCELEPRDTERQRRRYLGHAIITPQGR